MFKKFRNNRNLSAPPSAPTAEEIFSDLETFQVPSQVAKKKTNSKSESVQSYEDAWWDAFEYFAESHNELKNMNNGICNAKNNLETFKNELETKTQIIRKEILLQKELANVE